MECVEGLGCRLGAGKGPGWKPPAVVREIKVTIKGELEAPSRISNSCFALWQQKPASFLWEPFLLFSVRGAQWSSRRSRPLCLLLWLVPR